MALSPKITKAAVQAEATAFIVNVKTARSVGVTIPPEVLKRADKVVD